MIRILPLIVLLIVLWKILQYRQRKQRQYYLYQYRFPQDIRRKLASRYPDLNATQWLSVEAAMRQFFRLHQGKGKAAIAMPSRIVDDYWHEFILHTQTYRIFCRKALGRFIDHAPASQSDVSAMGQAMKTSWQRACRDEKLNPLQTSKLPLIFGIDQALGISNGFIHNPAQLAAAASTNSDCSSSDCSSGCSSGCSSNDNSSSDSGSSCSSDSSSGGD